MKKILIASIIAISITAFSQVEQGVPTNTPDIDDVGAIHQTNETVRLPAETVKKKTKNHKLKVKKAKKSSLKKNAKSKVKKNKKSLRKKT